MAKNNINLLKGINCVFYINRQKLGMILENTMFQKLQKNHISKYVNNEKCAPKLIFFNEKKIEKDSDNF